MTGARSHLRRAVYRLGPTALVLIYHRVAQLGSDPQLLAVTPSNFDRQMALLARDYHPQPLGALIGDLRGRRVKNRAVAVTFDDGYADNLVEALPILATHGVPATVFVSSGYLGGEREFWWDDLERIVLSPTPLPETIELNSGSGAFRFELGSEGPRPEANDREPWDVTKPPITQRQRLYFELAAYVRPCAAHDREAILEQLRPASVPQAARRSHRQLDSAEVTELASHALMTVGGHTSTHQVLSARAGTEQAREIQDDRQALTEMCPRPVSLFSYPYGALSDYTDESVELVRQAGYAGACSNHPGVVKPWTDPYRVPRQLVRDWDASEFGSQLEGWFHDPA